MAAFAKLAMIYTDPIWAFRIGLPVPLFLITLAVEIVSGYYLVAAVIRPSVRRFAYLVAMIVFGGFFGYRIAVFLGLLTDGCHCFGSFELPNGVMLFLAGFAFANLLACLRLENVHVSSALLHSIRADRHHLERSVWILVFVAATLLLTRTIEGRRFMGIMQAEVVIAVESRLDRKETENHHIVSIRNTTESAVLIRSSQTSCGCVVASELPLRLPADGVADVTVSITRVRDADQYRHAVVLFTDCPEQPKITLELTGNFD